jgi:hypothetical protein
MSDERTEVEVSKSGIKIAGKDITSVTIVATFFAVLGVGYLIHQHAGASGQQSDNLTKAMNSLVTAQRENNCIAAFRRDRDQTPTELLEFCKRFAQ